jgi:hypothetical protein
MHGQIYFRINMPRFHQPEGIPHFIGEIAALFGQAIVKSRSLPAGSIKASLLNTVSTVFSISPSDQASCRAI